MFVCCLETEVYLKASPSAHWNVGNSKHILTIFLSSQAVFYRLVNAPTLTDQLWYQNTLPTASYIFKLINITLKTNILVSKLYLSVMHTPRSDVTAAWQTKLRAELPHEAEGHYLPCVNCGFVFLVVSETRSAPTNKMIRYVLLLKYILIRLFSTPDNQTESSPDKNI